MTTVKGEYIESLWERAVHTLEHAKLALSFSSDTAANRSYYAAFYAVSAVFALEGKAFRRHSALEAAVHRDLVRSGRWPARLGEGYSQLLKTRSVSDYGPGQNVSREDAERAITAAAEILRAVAEAHPEHFTGPEGERPDADCEQGDR